MSILRSRYELREGTFIIHGNDMGAEYTYEVVPEMDGKLLTGHYDTFHEGYIIIDTFRENVVENVLYGCRTSEDAERRMNDFFNDILDAQDFHELGYNE